MCQRTPQTGKLLLNLSSSSDLPLCGFSNLGCYYRRACSLRVYLQGSQCTVLLTFTVLLPTLSDDAVAVSVITVPVGAVTCTVSRIVQVVPGAMPLPSWQITDPVAPTAG